jgi:predicted enzyme related to lactoylglutathione lyase
MATTATPATGIPATATRGRFIWHELMTSDVDAAKRFYQNVIGWETSKFDGNPDYTMWMAGQRPVGGVMTLPASAAAMGAPPHWLAYVEVPDVDATVDQATKLGATAVVPATTIDKVGRFAVLRDPAGAVIAVITSTTPITPEDDPTPLEFSWHELTTNDLPATISFYEQLFGWEKKSEFDMGEMGIYHMFGRDRFTYGGMMKRTVEMPPPGWLHYIRVADSADAAVERAKNAGGKVMMGPMEVPGGDRVAILTDPQGAAFAVHSKS